MSKTHMGKPPTPKKKHETHKKIKKKQQKKWAFLKAST